MRRNLKPITYNLKPTNGLSLVELLIYVAILSVMFVVIANTAAIVIGSFAKARTERNVTVESGVALERMVREARLAESIDLVGSVLGTDPGTLRLNTITSSVDVTPITRTFSLDPVTSHLMIQDGASPARELTSSGKITKLIFYNIANTLVSKSIHIEMTMQDGAGAASSTRNFYSTAGLRRSY